MLISVRKCESGILAGYEIHMQIRLCETAS